MGHVASIIKAFSCEACAMYVFNAMDIRSNCCDCFHCAFVTEKVDIPDDDSEISVEIEGCCTGRSK